MSVRSVSYGHLLYGFYFRKVAFVDFDFWESTRNITAKRCYYHIFGVKMTGIENRYTELSGIDKDVMLYLGGDKCIDVKCRRIVKMLSSRAGANKHRLYIPASCDELDRAAEGLLYMTCK